MSSVVADTQPTADDKTGNFHEEGGIAGTNAAGGLVISPDKPGPYSNPDINPDAHTNHTPVDAAVRNSIATVTVNWHVHPNGQTATHMFGIEPSGADHTYAIPGAINIVVSTRDHNVYFYNGSSSVQHMSLKKFMGTP
jgi:hypothetical protein